MSTATKAETITWHVLPDADPLLACDIAPRPLAYPLTDYHRAGVDGPLHYTWQDKPHRLLYDLIAAVRFYAVAESRHSPTGVVERKSETVSNNAQPPADPTALCLRLQAEADMWRANGDENLCVLLEEAIAAISQPPAPSVPGWQWVPVEPTPEMVAAYLAANHTYWKEMDEGPAPIDKWRNGTPAEATAESYAAMLSAAPPPVRERLTLDAVIAMAVGAGLGHALSPIGLDTGKVFRTDAAYRTSELEEFARAIGRALIGGEG